MVIIGNNDNDFIYRNVKFGSHDRIIILLLLLRRYLYIVARSNTTGSSLRIYAYKCLTRRGKVRV